MSTYPVQIKDFHDKDPSKLSLARSIIKALSPTCAECNKKITIKNCWADHSLCYIGSDKFWCSELCAYDLPNRLVSSDPAIREWAERHMKEINDERS